MSAVHRCIKPPPENALLGEYWGQTTISDVKGFASSARRK